MGAEDLEDALNRATPAPASAAGRMRFGERAKRAAIFSASDEAGGLGHGYVGGEHILLALLGERQSLAARVLGSCGITLERAREQVRGMTPAGGGSSARRDRNEEAEGVLERSQSEARALGRDRVDTAAVLLALLGRRGGSAVRALGDLGAEPQWLRERLFAEVGAGHGDYEGFSNAARDVVATAEDEARRLGCEQVGTAHLLLALLREGGVVSQVLAACGMTPQKVREAVTDGIACTDESIAGPIPLSRHALRALALGAAEARSTCSWANPAQVLLGVAAEGEDLGARVLLELGGDPDALRAAVLRTLSAGGGDGKSGGLSGFTEAAAEVLVLAQEEARALEHDHLGSEHILIGLVRAQENATSAALPALGTAVGRVREQVARAAGAAEQPAPALLPFASSATEAFRYAHRDVGWLEHDRIATEHLQLALTREEGGGAVRVLDELGADRGELRAQAFTALGAAWATRLSPAQEELSRQQQFLREAQASHRSASTDRQRRERALAIQLRQRAVDAARAKLLPQPCQVALTALVEFATEEWLGRQPPAEDADHRRWYRDHCAMNIHAQLVDVLFNPGLGPESNPILGHPGGPDAPDTPQTGVPFSLGS
jgi:ATP-dependent Clp protease ATP-binding subunit ClpA